MVSILVKVLLWLYYRVATRDRSKIENVYFPNNKIKSKSRYIRIGKIKILEGNTIHYYQNGQMESSLIYKENLLNGVQLYYDINGNIISRDLYKNGKCIASFKE